MSDIVRVGCQVGGLVEMGGASCGNARNVRYPQTAKMATHKKPPCRFVNDLVFSVMRDGFEERHRVTVDRVHFEIGHSQYGTALVADHLRDLVEEALSSTSGIRYGGNVLRLVFAPLDEVGDTRSQDSSFRCTRERLNYGVSGRCSDCCRLLVRVSHCLVAPSENDAASGGNPARHLLLNSSTTTCG